MSHRWHFFRAGGVDQVSLRDGRDLVALSELDQKLWVALAMPVKGTALDPETLALLDGDQDGRIRVQDVLDTVAWIEKTFERPDDVLQSRPQLELTAIADQAIVAAARRMLADLGKPGSSTISIDDTLAITKAFGDTVLNGDHIVIPASTEDPALRRVIEDVLAHVGSVTDRSGKPGIDQARADELFAAVDQRSAWLARGNEPAVSPLGEQTAGAAAAYLAVRDKLDDYFTRCRIAAFDPRSAAVLAGKDEALAAIAARTLTADDEELARLPLARPDTSERLPLAGLNPAWSQRMDAFVRAAVVPILGERDALTAADVAVIRDRLAGFLAWQGDKPVTKADALEPAWLEQLARPTLRAALADLIAKDGALAGEYAQISAVAKAVRLQRDAGRLVRNFINFSDFYTRQDGIFQAGTLYLDARAIHLCVPVSDAGKHATLATASGAYLLYCDITRAGETRQIAAALTNGDADNLFVGRNGVFYDRAGADWDATITKIIANPISVREAFWAPYKKLVRLIEDNVINRMAAAHTASTAKLDAVGKQVATADQAAAAPPPSAPPKKIDLGTVAAIGVAIGGIGTLVGTLLGSMFGLGKWLPLGIVALLLMISGPSMLLAWLKLRRRNLGPMLDANGWAINGRARINVAFGARMTELATLPKGSQRSLDDPFADKRTPWRRWVFTSVVLVLGASWWLGRLDPYLPDRVRSVTVLGADAPAYRKPAEPAPPAAPSAP